MRPCLKEAMAIQGWSRRCARLLALTLGFGVLSGCGPEEGHYREPCPPLPVTDEHVTIQTRKSEMKLRLPEYVDLRRNSSLDRGCQYLEAMFIDYLWHNGKLIPEAINRFKVSPKERMHVRVFVSDGYFFDSLSALPTKLQPWQIDPAIPHSKYPLEYYPRFYWDDPNTPTKRSRLDHTWGIRDTRYRDPRDGTPFKASCNIPTPEKFDSRTVLDAPFSNFGDSKCRGWVIVVENGKVVVASMDIWREGGTEINHIYDAVIDQIHEFIQE